MALVEVSQLTVRYDDLTAVDGVSFSAEAGAVTVLLGPNGAGKTSTIDCLEGFRRPSAGEVRVCGLDPVADHDRLYRRIGVMLQAGGVHTGIRVSEALDLYAAFYDDPRPPAELLAFVGLEDRARATWRTLSGGEQQRLSLALALVGRPEVAFLDEPTAGVDVAGRRLIRELIRSLRDDGVTVVLTTHDLAEVEELADRIVIIDRGRVVADGTPAELLTGGARDHFGFRAAAGLDVVGLSAAVGATVVEDEPGRYVVAGRPTPAAVAALTGWLAERDELLGDLSAGREGLEALFLRLTEESAAEDRAAGGGGSRRRGRARR